MFHNPGGDWHPGWGVVPRYHSIRTHEAFADVDV